MWRHLATVTACVDVILEYFATCPSVLSKALLAQYRICTLLLHKKTHSTHAGHHMRHILNTQNGANFSFNVKIHLPAVIVIGIIIFNFNFHFQFGFSIFMSISICIR